MTLHDHDTSFSFIFILLLFPLLFLSIGSSMDFILTQHLREHRQFFQQEMQRFVFQTSTCAGWSFDAL